MSCILCEGNVPITKKHQITVENEKGEKMALWVTEFTFKKIKPYLIEGKKIILRDLEYGKELLLVDP